MFLGLALLGRNPNQAPDVAGQYRPVERVLQRALETHRKPHGAADHEALLASVFTFGTLIRIDSDRTVLLLDIEPSARSRRAEERGT